MATLSYLEMDKWSADHASCENEHRFIVEMLNTRSYEPRTSKKYDLLSAKIRVSLKQFVASVNSLQQKLDEDYSLTKEEKERRQRLVENLQSCILILNAKFNARTDEDQRKSLLGYSETTGWASDDDDADTQTPLLVSESSDHVRVHQQRLMEEQEEGLERLSKVISRQKDIAVTIGNEVDYQNELVDNIAERMDRTNTSIQRETAHVQVVSKTDTTCGYWMVILSLFVAIVIVCLL